MKRIKIGISSCLLGRNVRYDGGHRHDLFIAGMLGRYFEWVPVCPEVECGLGIPREAMRLVDGPASLRLVTIRTGIDHTEVMQKWTAEKLKELQRENLCGFICKSRSPSSAIGDVEIYSPSGMLARKGAGIFGGAFMKHFPHVPVIDDSQLHDPVQRKIFLQKVFACYKKRNLNNNP